MSRILFLFTDPSGASVSASQTLGGVTQTATAQALVQASASETLGAVLGAGVIQALIQGSAAQVLGGVTSSGAIQVLLQASGSVTLGGVVQTATAVVLNQLNAQANVTLGNVTSSGTVSVVVSGTSNVSLGAVTSSGTVRAVVSAFASQLLDNVTSTGTVITNDVQNPGSQMSGGSSFPAMKQGDLEPILSTMLLDSTGLPVDLTTAITLTVRFADSLTRTEVFARPATVDDIRGGRISYVWQAGDTDVPGVYYVEFAVQWPGPRVQTYPNDGYLAVEIQPKL